MEQETPREAAGLETLRCRQAGGRSCLTGAGAFTRAQACPLVATEDWSPMPEGRGLPRRGWVGLCPLLCAPAAWPSGRKRARAGERQVPRGRMQDLSRP